MIVINDSGFNIKILLTIKEVKGVSINAEQDANKK